MTAPAKLKLTPARFAVLKYLSEPGPMTVAFWGGKPHCRLPNGLKYAALQWAVKEGLVRESNGERFDRVFTLRAAGRAAIETMDHEWATL